MFVFSASDYFHSNVLTPQMMNTIERKGMVPESMLKAACLGDYIGSIGLGVSK